LLWSQIFGPWKPEFSIKGDYFEGKQKGKSVFSPSDYDEK
jgi:hypothetical protein